MSASMTLEEKLEVVLKDNQAISGSNQECKDSNQDLKNQIQYLRRQLGKLMKQKQKTYDSPISFIHGWTDQGKGKYVC